MSLLGAAIALIIVGGGIYYNFIYIYIYIYIFYNTKLGTKLAIRSYRQIKAK
jgi:hypothetical protein